jgi:TRAP-type C4-dicarboxylate transport system substrate-binding protein
MKKQKSSFLYLGIMLAAFNLLFLTGFSAESMAAPLELKVATWNPPPPFPISVTEEKWAKMVEEKSGGEVTFKFFWAGGLASLRDTYRTVQSGVADIGFWLPGVLPGLHELNEYTVLPMLGVDSMETATKVYHEMRKKFPELDAEFKGLRLLWASSMPPNQLHFTKKTGVRLPSDMKGIKLIGSPTAAEFVNSTGAVSIFKPPSDYYMSLQKGLVQGTFQHYPFISAFKLEELLVSHTNCGLGGFNLQMMGFWMNQAVWDKLSPKAQKAFDDCQAWIQSEDIRVNTMLIDKAMADAKAKGHEVVELTPDEKQVWFEQSEPIRQKWAEAMEAKGKPGKAVYQEALKLIRQYNKTK